MRFIWIRHGKTLWNREFRLQGSSDILLSKEGVLQSKLLAASFCKHPQYLFVSPLKRARQFARPLAGLFNLQPIIREELREMSFGNWEGLRYEDMDGETKKLYLAWYKDPGSIVPPEGESFDALTGRVNSFIAAAQGMMQEGESAAIVTHGGVIRAAVVLALGLPAVKAGCLQVDAASVTVLDFYAGTWRLVKFNDTCHLQITEGDKK